MSWSKFLNLSGIINCVTKSQNCSQWFVLYVLGKRESRKVQEVLVDLNPKCKHILRTIWIERHNMLRWGGGTENSFCIFYTLHVFNLIVAMLKHSFAFVCFSFSWMQLYATRSIYLYALVPSWKTQIQPKMAKLEIRTVILESLKLWRK